MGRKRGGAEGANPGRNRRPTNLFPRNREMTKVLGCAIVLAAILMQSQGSACAELLPGSNTVALIGGQVASSISFPSNCRVTNGTMTAGTPSDGSLAPMSPSIDLGSDGMPDWEFSGQGYGNYGRQEFFGDNSTSARFNFTSAGTANTTIMVPRNASISSASINLTGIPTYSSSNRTDTATADFQAGALSNVAVSGGSVTLSSLSASWTQTSQADFTAGAGSNLNIQASGDVSLSYQPWPFPAWPYRKQLTIYHTKVAATLSSFPVLFSRSSDAELAARARDDSLDIFFTLYGSSTKLSHEIELFNGGTGQIAAWINIPTLSSGADTLLWMYYGNPTASDQQDVDGTWDSNHRLVLHMEETPGAIQDSSGYGNTGTPSGVTQAQAGKIAGGDSFDGSNDYVNFGSSSTLQVSGQATISAWVLGTASTSLTWGRILAAPASFSDNAYALCFKPGQSKFYAGYGGNTMATQATYTTQDGSYSGGSWVHVVMTYDGAVHVYLNGASQTLVEVTSDLIDLAGTTVWAGGKQDSSKYYQGAMDELRLCSVARPSSWILTEYRNQNDPASFITTGSEIVMSYYDSGVLTSGISASFVAGASSWNSISWTASLPSGTSISVQTRTGNSMNPDDGTWSSWATIAASGSAVPSPSAKYLQYKTTLATTVGTATPVLHDVTLALSRFQTGGSLTSAFSALPSNRIITSSRCSWSGARNGQSVSIEVTGDGGGNWTAAANASWTSMPGGHSPGYRLTLAGDGCYSPIVDQVVLECNFTILPSGPVLRIDGSDAWSRAGTFSGMQHLDLASNMTSALPGAWWTTDMYGNQVAVLDIEVSCGSDGILSLDGLRIDYSLISIVPGFESALNSFLSATATGFPATFPVSFSSGSAGSLEIGLDMTLDTAPVLNGTPLLQMAEDTPATFDLLSFFTDDGGPENLSFILAGQGDQQSVGAALDGTILALSSAANWSGSVNLTIAAIDAAGMNLTANFTATIAPVNDPPLFAPRSIFVQVGTTSVVDLSSSITDVDDPIGEITASFESGAPQGITLAGLVLTINMSSAGLTNLTLNISDGQAGTTGLVSIEAVNGLPPVVSRPDNITVMSNSTATLDLGPLATDPEGREITWNASAPANGLFTAWLDGSILHVSSMQGADGSASILLSATDPTGLSTSFELGVTVTGRVGPSIAPPVTDMELDEGENVTIDLASHLAAGTDQLREWTASATPGAVNLSLSGSILFIEAVGKAGQNATITVSAVDSQGATASANFTITIRTAAAANASTEPGESSWCIPCLISLPIIILIALVIALIARRKTTVKAVAADAGVVAEPPVPAPAPICPPCEKPVTDDRTECECGTVYHKACLDRITFCPFCGKKSAKAGHVSTSPGTEASIPVYSGAVDISTMVHRAEKSLPCGICLGHVKIGTTHVSCNCGRTYHTSCIERTGVCNGCKLRYEGHWDGHADPEATAAGPKAVDVPGEQGNVLPVAQVVIKPRKDRMPQAGSFSTPMKQEEGGPAPVASPAPSDAPGQMSGLPPPPASRGPGLDGIIDVQKMAVVLRKHGMEVSRVLDECSVARSCANEGREHKVPYERAKQELKIAMKRWWPAYLSEKEKLAARAKNEGVDVQRLITVLDFIQEAFASGDIARIAALVPEVDRESGSTSDKLRERMRQKGLEGKLVERMQAPAMTACSICRGISKKGTMVVKCSCGKFFHEPCATRVGCCPLCGAPFNF